VHRICGQTRIIVNGKSISYDGIRNGGDAMADNAEWEARVKGMLKAELKRRNVSYAQLVEKLAAIGVSETEPNIRNKLARGKFTAVFMLQCLKAIGVSSLQLE
jgi:hypothetical protein